MGPKIGDSEGEDFELDSPLPRREPVRYRSELISTFQELHFALLDPRLDRWIFRGQRRPEWPLTTVLERAIPDGETRNLAEPSILEEFTRKAHHHLQAQAIPETELEWLALLQHFGGPTRLQDWTAAPLVALFFAIEQKADTDSYAVWAADADWLQYTSRDLIAKALNGDLAKATKLLRAATHEPEALWRVLHSRAQAIAVLNPRRQSERLTIQQGRFLIPCDIRRSFLDNWPETPSEEPTLIRFDVHSELRTEALEYLQKVNITRASLFPGLDGLAQSLHNFLIYEPPEKLQASNLRKSIMASSVVSRLLAPWEVESKIS